MLHPTPFIGTLLLALVSTPTAPLDEPPPGPGIYFIDVGQGSAALLLGTEGDAVLVDSGPVGGAEAVLAALAIWQLDSLSLWVHTHFDADHIGGFGPVRAGLDGRPGTPDDVDAALLWDRGLQFALPDTDASSLYLRHAGEQRSAPLGGESFRAPGLNIRVLPLDAPPVDAAENQRGLALCVDVGPVRALLPGDLSADRIAPALHECAPVDLLWVSHHGADDGLSAELLDALEPRMSVISAGHDNLYCHPRPLSLARLHNLPLALLDGAGLAARPKACAPLGARLGPDHHVIAGGLWIGGGQAWVHEPGGWTPAPEVFEL